MRCRLNPTKHQIKPLIREDRPQKSKEKKRSFLFVCFIFFQILVDRVRAGVIESWLPRRLGGGLGQRQKGTQRFAWKVTPS